MVSRFPVSSPIKMVDTSFLSIPSMLPMASDRVLPLRTIWVAGPNCPSIYLLPTMLALISMALIMERPLEYSELSVLAKRAV